MQIRFEAGCRKPWRSSVVKSMLSKLPTAYQGLQVGSRHNRHNTKRPQFIYFCREVQDTASFATQRVVALLHGSYGCSFVKMQISSCTDRHSTVQARRYPKKATTFASSTQLWRRCALWLTMLSMKLGVVRRARHCTCYARQSSSTQKRLCLEHA